MISNAQKSLIKRAQRELKLPDSEYRQDLATVTGMPDCTSSKDPRMTDRMVDNLLSFWEAVFWRLVDAKQLVPAASPKAVFRCRHFWSTRNPAENTSRDQYADRKAIARVAAAEAALARIGYGPRYCAAIRVNLGTNDPWKYAYALERTLRAKAKAQENAETPF